MPDSIVILVPLAAAGGSCFFWLLRQTARQTRLGWVTELMVPLLLAAYTFLGALSDVPFSAGSVTSGAALLAGMFFACSPARTGAAKLVEGRGSLWPLLLWGAGAALHVAEPALPELGGISRTANQCAGFTLLGQGAAALFRLFAARRGNLRKRSMSGLLTLCGLASVVVAWLAAGGGGAASTGGALLVGESDSFGNGKPAVWVFDVGGGLPREIPLQGADPSWSRDGTRMAVIARQGDFSRIVLAAADGTSPHTVATMPGYANRPFFSRDGSKLYFCQGKSWVQFGLWEVDLPDGTPRGILPDTENVMSPKLAPDGGRIALARLEDFNNTHPPEIQVLDTASGARTTLLTDPTRKLKCAELAWVPDGTALITVMTRDWVDYQLERLDIATGERTKIGPPMSDFRPTHLAFAGGQLFALLRRIPAPSQYGDGDVWLLDAANGSRQRQLATGRVKPLTMSGGGAGN